MLKVLSGYSVAGLRPLDPIARVLQGEAEHEESERHVGDPVVQPALPRLFVVGSAGNVCRTSPIDGRRQSEAKKQGRAYNVASQSD